MRRFVVSLVAAVLALSPVASAGVRADETAINENPECQRLWHQLADPVLARMLWYVNAADQYPILPNGRPPVGAYPWGPAVWARPGGPSWFVANNYLPYGALNVGLTTAYGFPFAPFNPLVGATPLSTAFVAQQVAQAAGGLSAVGAGDLIALAGLRQSEIGNVFAAGSLREAVIGNRLAAAEFNLNYAGYPMAQAVNYREILEGLDFYVRNACPRAPAEDRNGGDNGGATTSDGGRR
ncbi:MAG TPA: hypothetical protein VKZ60_09175 [Chloroflexota bacterium]|jgi:hypothetical protein|nr:hypothetical protein [Chloroflexota bacterium]